MTGTSQKCPRCSQEPLKTWNELSVEQQEVVRRLPESAEYSGEERQATHWWCTRCWYEEAGNTERSA